MSLIHDALDKARTDADARAERERATGGPSADYRPPRAHLPRRSGWAPGVAVGLAIGALLAGGVGVGWWLGRVPEPPEPTAVATIAEAPTPAPEPQAITPLEPAPADEPRPIEEPPIEAPEPPEPATVAEPVDTPPPVAETEPPAVAPTVPEDPTPSEPAGAEPEPTNDATRATPRPALIQPPEQVGQVGDDVYVLEADLGDVVLELDFIVWGAAPFAQINGRQVEVDQAVDGGFLVDTIEREQVTLRHADGRAVVLRIR